MSQGGAKCPTMLEGQNVLPTLGVDEQRGDLIQVKGQSDSPNGGAKRPSCDWGLDRRAAGEGQG